MKKLALILAFATSIACYGQKFKIDISGGYSSSFLSVSGYSETAEYDSMSTNETETYEKLGFASGWIGRLGLTYMINDQLFFNCAGRYQKSGEKEQILESSSYTYSGGYSETNTYKVYTEMSNFEVQLGLGIQRDLIDKFSLSLSAGPSVGLYGKMTTSELLSYSSNCK